jgi:hypothetical protein
MKKRWGFAAVACVAIACTWSIGQSSIQAEEEEKEVRIQVRVDASEDGESDSPARAIKKRVIAVAVHAHDDLEEKLEEILKEAGLEGDDLKEVIEKVLEACKESCSAGANAIRQIQIPQVMVVGPDGKQQKIELRSLGNALSIGGEANEELTEKIREKVEQALEKSGLKEPQLEQVRKALERVEKMHGLHPKMLDPQAIRVQASQVPEDYKYMIGIACSPLNDALRSELKLADGQGLVVVNVFDDTPAKKAGVEEGDVLVKVAGKNVTEIQDLVKAVQAAGKDEKKLTIQLLRDGKKQTVQVAPAAREALRVTVEAEIDEAFESLRENMPESIRLGVIQGQIGPDGIGELGPGVIAPFGQGKANEEAVKALKKQVETLSRQVKQLQAELKKLKAAKD